MRRSVSGLAAAAALLISLPVAAAEDHWDGGYEIQAERRSGLALGITLGSGLGVASGYPNDVEKIGEPEFRSETGLASGGQVTAWLGGALRDWFIVGLGLHSFGFGSEGNQAGGGAFILHVEAFPLWSLGGRFRDLSFFTDFGAGGLVIEGGPENADGGALSLINAGVSFEAFRWGPLALGPSLTGTYAYSQSIEAGAAFIGARATLYGGP
ncbi:MAG TPA: hypothetical protein VKY73_13485 [Polyangiaceae bacterium]|nr:hypothetical protein [Polyangiaceae bacterium]